MWTSRRSGQTHQRGILDHRSPYEHDRTRVIHAPSFRRLQGKTQILGTAQGDFHRTRLTHSLEVASIGSSIVRNLSQNSSNIQPDLLPQDDLIHVICLLHDIGHPPFGHSGEIALNYMMLNWGGFEGNAHSLRLLTKLEKCYGDYGLDLTRRALLGILKYPTQWSDVYAKQLPDTQIVSIGSLNACTPPKAYFDSEASEVEWLLEPFIETDRRLLQSLKLQPSPMQHGQAAHYSFDCSIMDTADDIAYGIHDLEDAVHLKLIQRDHLDTQEFEEIFKAINSHYHCAQFLDLLFDRAMPIRKQAIGEMVNYLVAATYIDVTHPEFIHPLLKYNVVLRPEAQALLDYFMHCIYTHVIDSEENRTFQYGGQTVVRHLFEAFSSNPLTLLDDKNRALFQAAYDQSSAYRVISDYIAGMTDGYAHRMHERLFGFNNVYRF